MATLENAKHHYVPQLILRNFGIDGRETLYAFDKQTNRRFQVAVKDAAAERGYNTFKTEYGAGCGEEMFTDIETKASPIIHKIIDAKRLHRISSEERSCLIVLATAQLLRSKGHRSTIDDIGEILLALKMKYPTLRSPSQILPPDDETTKQIALSTFKDQLLEMAYTFLHKDIVLFEAPELNPFIIGDNPLVRTNSLNRSDLMGTHGLNSEGVEIYFPISPRLTLGFMCPTIRMHMQMQVAVEGRKATNALDYMCSIEYGKTARVGPENVLYLNSMQVLNASRFLYGSTPDFSLVEELIMRNPDVRDRPRLISR